MARIPPEIADRQENQSAALPDEIHENFEERPVS